MPLQLWETTLDPEKRLLKQLVVEDAAEANVVFSSLMGAKVRFVMLAVLRYAVWSVLIILILGESSGGCPEATNTELCKNDEP